jgi:hypothetical protein
MAVQPITLAAQMMVGSIAPFLAPEDASETYGRGAVLDIGTNTIREDAAGGNTTLIGISADRASGTTNNLSPYYPAFPGVVFEGNLSTGPGASPTAFTLVVGAFGNDYESGLDTSQTSDQGNTITGVWYVDQSATTNTIFTVIGFKDAVGTSDARVYFVFDQSITAYA